MGTVGVKWLMPETETSCF